MKIAQLRSQDTLSRSLVYMITGSFLISYSDVVQAKVMFLVIGFILCILSFFSLVISLCVHKWLRKMVKIDSNLKIFTMGMTFYSFFIGLITSSDKAYFDTRFWLGVSWMLLLIGISIILVILKTIKNIRQRNTRYLYIFCRDIAFATLFMGLILVLQGIFDPTIFSHPTTPSRWVMYPFVYLGLSVLLVIPMLVFLPKSNNH